MEKNPRVDPAEAVPPAPPPERSAVDETEPLDDAPVPPLTSEEETLGG